MSQFEFGKTNRLLKSKDYTEVLSSKHKFVNSNLVLLARKRNDSQSTSRIGLVVSKKVGSAVTRNQIKRYLREHFRLHPKIRLLGIDLVVIARPRASNATRKRIGVSFDAGLESISRQLSA